MSEPADTPMSHEVAKRAGEVAILAAARACVEVCEGMEILHMVTPCAGPLSISHRAVDAFRAVVHAVTTADLGENGQLYTFARLQARSERIDRQYGNE
jgi:hypothetical protein